RSPAPEHLGRALVRTDVLNEARVDVALSHHRDATRGGFPDPQAGLWGTDTHWAFARLEQERQVIEHFGKHGHAALVDLDLDTPNRTTATPQELATERKFDAEVMFLRVYDRLWVYHDTDRDGAADLVTFTRDVSRGT